MTWDEIVAAFGSVERMLGTVNAVLREAGDAEIRAGTLYVWRSRGLPRARRWHLAEALRRAGRQTDVRELAGICAERSGGEKLPCQAA